MHRRSLSLVPLLSAALLAGCWGERADDSYELDDGVVPAGAIPAAPDVRPGTQAAPGMVQQPGVVPGQASDPSVQTTGAGSPGVIDTAAAAAPDTVAR